MPVAQDVQYTQYRSVDDELTRYFSRLMGQVRNFNGTGEATTRQGFYAFDAPGHVYGAMNRRSARRLVSLLETAKEEFEARNVESIELAEAPARSARPRPPRGSAVIRVYARIDAVDPRDRDGGRRGRRNRGWTRRNGRLGRDHLWVRPDELLALRAGRLSDALAGRLLLNHCLDNIRGEPDPWELAHVRAAEFDVDRSSISLDGRPVTEVVVRGGFDIETGERDVGWRRPLPTAGYAGRMTLRVRFRADGELLDWRGLVEGRAFGRSRYTNGEPPGRFPLRIGFVLSPEPERDVEVPPGMYFRGSGLYWDPGLRLPHASAPRR